MRVRMFMPQFAGLVESGKKRQTIRPLPKRFPKVGELESWRKWSARPYNSKQVELAKVELTGIHRVSILKSPRIVEEEQMGETVWVEIDGRRIDMVDWCTLAVDDGFETAVDMMRWFREQHELPFSGILIKAKDASLCELRPGIGLCDDCSLPKWPQKDLGYGHMVCLDCLKNFQTDSGLVSHSLNLFKTVDVR